MRLLHKDRHTESVGHDGVEYERDEHGAFELPHALAESLLERFPHIWEIAPEPVPAAMKPKRGGTIAKVEPEQPDASDGDNSAEDEDGGDPEQEKAPADALAQGDDDGGTPASARKTSTRKAAAAAQ